jgi:DNA-binding NtrC family response regulator
MDCRAYSSVAAAQRVDASASDRTDIGAPTAGKQPRDGALPVGTRAAMKALLDKCADNDVPIQLVRNAVMREYIMLSLEHHRRNFCKTARALGIHRNTLSRQIDELDIRDEVDALLGGAGRRAR